MQDKSNSVQLDWKVRWPYDNMVEMRSMYFNAVCTLWCYQHLRFSPTVKWRDARCEL